MADSPAAPAPALATAPAVHDALFGWDPGPEVDTYVDLLNRHGSCRVHRVLDVGCGTGRLLRPLAASGLDAVGIERSPDLARHARERAAAEKVKIDVTVADPREFKLARPCDGAISTLCAYRQHLAADDVWEHLYAVSGALVARGAYVVDLRLFAPGAEGDAPHAWKRTREGLEVEAAWRIAAGPDWGRRTVTEELCVTATAGGKRTEYAERRELRVWTVDDFRGHAWAGGFEVIDWFRLPACPADPFRPEPWRPAEVSARVLAVLRRREVV
ncbi:MAG: class I SAM-dependent methyltransferase [Planctomycetes bacterium]|nr:class I SAM-dependent methyltransferase [Planctomycetota bacterium]